MQGRGFKDLGEEAEQGKIRAALPETSWGFQCFACLLLKGFGSWKKGVIKDFSVLLNTGFQGVGLSRFRLFVKFVEGFGALRP